MEKSWVTIIVIVLIVVFAILFIGRIIYNFFCQRLMIKRKYQRLKLAQDQMNDMDLP